MRVGRTLRSWKVSHTSVVGFRTTAVHVKQSSGEFDWLTIATQLCGLIDTCAEDQRFVSSNRLCYLSYFMYVKQTRKTKLKRQMDALGKFLRKITGYSRNGYQLVDYSNRNRSPLPTDFMNTNSGHIGM